MKQKLLILLLAVLLAVQAYGMAEVKKTEIVYAGLDNAGAIQAVYIVNSFESTEPEQVSDKGDYAKVTNLSGTQTLEYADGAVLLDLPVGRFDYQGDPKGSTLPWTFSLGYQLDGSPVETSALSGASGKLRLELGIQVNETLRAYAQGSTLQVTVTLDGDRALNINAPRATMARAGGNVLVTFVVLPGQDAAFEVTCDVQDFSMAGVQIAGTRMAVDNEQYLGVMARVLEGNPMKDAVTPMMENYLRAMEGPAPLSFVDPDNGQVDSLQFVMMTPGIPAAQKDESVNPHSEGESSTVLTRLADLFGG